MINKLNKNIIKLNSREPSRAERFTLNFFQVYVYLTIIKYYSIYSLKLYSNSFLNLLNFSLQKAFVYLSVFMNIYFMDIMTRKVFYQIYFLFYRRLFMPNFYCEYCVEQFYKKTLIKSAKL